METILDIQRPRELVECPKRLAEKITKRCISARRKLNPKGKMKMP